MFGWGFGFVRATFFGGGVELEVGDGGGGDDVLVLGHADADGFGDAELLHGDAVDDIGAVHGALVVGDDDELAVGDEFVQHLEEAGDVRFVEGGVELVQHAEGAGFDHVDGEEQGDCGHAALATGKEGDGGEFFAGRFGDDFDAGLEGIIGVDEFEIGFALFAKEFFEVVLEVLADLGEGLGEHGFGGLVDLGDDVEEFFLGADEVVVLGVEEVVALFELFEFLDGVEVDGADGFEFLAEFADDFDDEVPVGLAFLAGDGEVFVVDVVIVVGDEDGFGGFGVGVGVGGRGRIGGVGVGDFRCFFGGGFSLAAGAGDFLVLDGHHEDMVVGFEGFDLEVVAFVDLGDEVFESKFDAGELDFGAVAGLGEAGGLLAESDELGLELGDFFEGFGAFLEFFVEGGVDAFDGFALGGDLFGEAGVFGFAGVVAGAPCVDFVIEALDGAFEFVEA